MKTVILLPAAQASLRRYRSEAPRLLAKIDRYAATGAGDVRQLVGTTGKRLRVGDFRIVFEETGTEIVVSAIGPRGSVYD